MKDKLIKIISEYMNLESMFVGATEKFADYLISNNVFVLPEKMKDSWELTSAFVLRLFCANEEEVNKMKQEFGCQKIKQILTDFRGYILKEWDNAYVDEEPIFTKALADLAEYAEKLGVEL